LEGSDHAVTVMRLGGPLARNARLIRSKNLCPLWSAGSGLRSGAGNGRIELGAHQFAEQHDEHDWVVIEGVGGCGLPINQNSFMLEHDCGNSNWPVTIGGAQAIGNRNHTLLTFVCLAALHARSSPPVHGP